MVPETPASCQQPTYFPYHFPNSLALASSTHQIVCLLTLRGNAFVSSLVETKSPWVTITGDLSARTRADRVDILSFSPATFSFLSLRIFSYCDTRFSGSVDVEDLDSLRDQDWCHVMRALS